MEPSDEPEEQRITRRSRSVWTVLFVLSVVARIRTIQTITGWSNYRRAIKATVSRARIISTISSSCLATTTSPRARRGSAIFVHLARDGYTPTAGCIGLARHDLLMMLARAKTRVANRGHALGRRRRSRCRREHKSRRTELPWQSRRSCPCSAPQAEPFRDLRQQGEMR